MALVYAIYFKALGLALSFVGTAVLIAGTMKTDTQIEHETKPTLRRNWAARKFLLKARSISLIGLILISLGFLFQFVGLFIEIY